jgi:hypothetical protein
MKLSPIQLLESSFEIVSIKRDFESSAADDISLTDHLDLQVFRQLRHELNYWSEDDQVDPPELKNRTYAVSLGIRTPPEKNYKHYNFEMVVTGVFVCLQEKFETKTVQDMVFEYGLTLLYGMIREQFAATTSRMRGGTKVLPIVSFLGEKADIQKDADAQSANQLK